MNLTAEILVIVLMLLVNAVFAAYEMALAAISIDRLKALAASRARGAARALSMKERMGRSLAVVQVGITLAGAIAAATGGAGVEEYMSPRLADAFSLTPSAADALALVLFVLPLSAVTIVFGELIPKTIALRNQESVALFLSPLMMVLASALYPAVRALEWSVESLVRMLPGSREATEEERDDEQALRELVRTAASARAARLIGRLEEHVVASVSRFPTRRVEEMMVPVGQMAAIPETASLADALVTAHLHMHTRYPVCKDAATPSSVTGYVNFKDIISALRLRPNVKGVAGIVRPMPQLRKGTTLSEALDYLLRGGHHIAAIAEHVGTVVGIVTLEDLVGQLVGRISDEYDRLPNHLYAMGGQWIAGGGVLMESLRKTMAVGPGASAIAGETLQAWFTARHGATVSAGSSARDDDIEVEVRKVRRGSIHEAIVHAIRRQEDPARPATT